LQSTLSPHGPAAGDIATLWWVLFWISAAVCVIVFALLLFALFRRRETVDRRPIEANALVLTLGVAIPLIILLGTFGFSLHTMQATANPDTPSAIKITVTGRQWWWEVRYQDPPITTANELHIPVGQPVELTLVSDNVIHSFWAPELQKKTDMIPGQVNTSWIQADEPGDYRGQCAEFCGTQHAHMAFHVIAQTRADYGAWAQTQRQPAVAPPPDVARGAQVFSSAGCISCHSIRYGSGSVGGSIGPDLTHLASRGYIAAGELHNVRGNLAGWIVDSQAIKPGNFMPAIPLSSDDLQALLGYLESLK
jgi:cytochrome c oxidase subunit II